MKMGTDLPINPDNPFEGDLTGDRHRLATAILGLLRKEGQLDCLGLDAPYGAGKSWFAERLAPFLESNDIKTVYYRATDHDSDDEPLPSLIGAVSQFLATDAPLVKAMETTARKLLPKVARLGLTIVMDKAMGPTATEMLLKPVAETAEQCAEDMLEGWVKDAAARKESLEALRGKMKAELSDARRVIIVDELDRCHPRFAVELVQRLHQFFCNTNLTFILFVNRSQLERHFEHEFGANAGDFGYLDKYVQFWLHLDIQNGKASVTCARALHDSFFPRGCYRDQFEELTHIYKINARTAIHIAQVIQYAKLQMELSEKDFVAAVMKVTRPVLAQKAVQGGSNGRFALRDDFVASAGACAWRISARLRDLVHEDLTNANSEIVEFFKVASYL